MSGLVIHVGGELRYEPLRYVGGSVIEWTSTSLEVMNMGVLSEAIYNSGFEGEIFAMYYQKPLLTMAGGLTPMENDEDVLKMVSEWRLNERIDVYVVMEPPGGFVNNEQPIGENNEQPTGENNEQPTGEQTNEQPTGENNEQPTSDNNDLEEDGIDEPREDDDEFLEGVDYGTDNEDEERNNFIVRAKDYVNEVAKRVAQYNEFVGTDVGQNAENEEAELDGDDERNWSLSENEDDKADDGEEAKEPPGWHKTNKVYFDEEHSNLQLHMIFSGPSQFKKALVEDSIINNAPIKFVKNDSVRVRARCVSGEKVEMCLWWKVFVKSPS